jgi:hypothetical protein
LTAYQFLFFSQPHSRPPPFSAMNSTPALLVVLHAQVIGYREGLPAICE